MLISDEIRVRDLIQAITDKENELREAEYIVRYHPAIIHNLQKELFNILKGDEPNTRTIVVSGGEVK